MGIICWDEPHGRDVVNENEVENHGRCKFMDFLMSSLPFENVISFVIFGFFFRCNLASLRLHDIRAIGILKKCEEGPKMWEHDRIDVEPLMLLYIGKVHSKGCLDDHVSVWSILSTGYEGFGPVTIRMCMSLHANSVILDAEA